MAATEIWRLPLGLLSILSLGCATTSWTDDGLSGIPINQWMQACVDEGDGLAACTEALAHKRAELNADLYQCENNGFRGFSSAGHPGIAILGSIAHATAKANCMKAGGWRKVQ